MIRLFILGQAPARPGSRHDIPGTYLRPWLRQIGLTDGVIDEYCRFYALVGVFPGSGKSGHQRPTPAQILDHRPVLISALRDFQPDIILPVGSMAITEVLPDSGGKLTDIIGKCFSVNPFACLERPIRAVPLPHPSGRSTWLNQHKGQVLQALELLRSVTASERS